MIDPISCVISGHAWIRFENHKEIWLACTRQDCRALVKVMKVKKFKLGMGH